MTNWKTTLGGALSALGTSLMGIGVLTAVNSTQFPTRLVNGVILTGFMLSALGKFFGMLFASDKGNGTNGTNKTNGMNAAAALLIPFLCAGLLFGGTGCKTPRLEPGGAYSPTNSTGQVIYNDIGLALADASYKFAYETVVGVSDFEDEYRAEIFALNPTVGLKVKHELDRIRPQIVAVNYRWALARQAYKLNPTPAGLSVIQTILLEIQRLVPVVQSQIDPVISLLTKPNP